MAHTPFGYRIRKGKAIIDEPAAEKIRQLYKNYLGGLSMENAAKEAGIEIYHGTVNIFNTLILKYSFDFAEVSVDKGYSAAELL